MTAEPQLSFLSYAQRNRGVGQAEDIWQDLARRVKEGKVIPILSNSMRDERFMRLFNQPDKSLGSFVAESWAQEIGYPMQDSGDLARVAQFHQVTALNPEKAKRDYLDFIVQGLMGFAQNTDAAAAARIEEKNLAQTPDLLFADLVTELGYPPLQPDEQDPLRLLAKLPLPIYITTSFYDFLERALVAEGKTVRSEVCTWSGQTSKIDRQFLPDPTFDPKPETPLVFHLFGAERFPHTMVLSVDDYLNFLVNIFLRETEARSSSGTGAPSPVPPYLWERIVELPLLIMGFKLHDWDFQVLYRGIVTAKPAVANRDAGLVIQLEPDKRSGVTNPEQAKKYLREYFSQEARFKVEFQSPDDFVVKLYQTYKQRS